MSERKTLVTRPSIISSKAALSVFVGILFFTAMGSAAENYEKLLDFRDDVRSPELDRNALSQDQKDRLLTSLYPSGDEEVEGEIQAVRGSFSKLDGTETLITFASETGGSHASRHGNIILLEGQKVIAWANDGDTELIEAIADFDQDGLQEAVTSLTDGGQGEFHTEVSTLTFKGGHIAVLNTPITINGNVDERNCDHDDGIVYTSGFYFLGSQLIQKNYFRRCDQDTYQDYSEGQMIPNDWDHDGISDDDGG